jgi:hypothetical protein
VRAKPEGFAWKEEIYTMNSRAERADWCRARRTGV